MAISPITSVSFRNNYNNVNFEGKKEKNNVDIYHVSNTIKSIPLATLLALSPLNNVEAQTRAVSGGTTEVVNVKSYNNIVVCEDSPAPLKFRFLSSDSEPQTVEKVTATSQESLFSYESPTIDNAEVKSVNNYVLSLVGADGKCLGDITHSQLELRAMPNNEGRRRYIPVANEQIVNDITEFAKSNKNNGAVEIKNIKNTLYGRPDRMPSSLIKPDMSWKAKTMAKDYYFGDIVGLGSLSTKMGEYKITYYSTDEDTSNAEVIAFERNDGIRFKLDGLRVVNLKFTAEDTYNEDPIGIACLDISWPNVGKYTIFDNELASALLKLGQSQDYAKAVNLSEQSYNVVVGSDGALTIANK